MTEGSGPSSIATMVNIAVPKVLSLVVKFNSPAFDTSGAIAKREELLLSVIA